MRMSHRPRLRGRTSYLTQLLVRIKNLLAVVSVVPAVSTFGRLDESRGVYQIVGSGLYLAGVILTAVYHVPRNDALGRLEPDSEAAAKAWNIYLPNRTRWNHVRTLNSLSASVVLMLSLLVE